jgi:uncharacterized membrane protein YozB (DUF420 family)
MLMTEILPEPSIFPNITVSLNSLSLLLLLAGWWAIKRGEKKQHAGIMIAALISSSAFLAVYLVHHAINGSIPYPFRDWSYTVYLVILIPHIIAAGLMVPFILRGVYLAFKKDFGRHARLMRWVWPVWVYVSLSGILVYLMLYTFPGMRS